MSGMYRGARLASGQGRRGNEMTYTMFRYYLSEWVDEIRDYFRCFHGHDWDEWRYLEAKASRPAYYGRVCKRCPLVEVHPALLPETGPAGRAEQEQK